MNTLDDIPRPLLTIMCKSAWLAWRRPWDLLVPYGDRQVCNAKRVAWLVATERGYSGLRIARLTGYHHATIYAHLSRARDLLDDGDNATQSLYDAVTRSLTL